MSRRKTKKLYIGYKQGRGEGICPDTYFNMLDIFIYQTHGHPTSERNSKLVFQYGYPKHSSLVFTYFEIICVRETPLVVLLAKHEIAV